MTERERLNRSIADGSAILRRIDQDIADLQSERSAVLSRVGRAELKRRHLNRNLDGFYAQLIDAGLMPEPA